MSNCMRFIKCRFLLESKIAGLHPLDNHVVRHFLPARLCFCDCCFLDSHAMVGEMVVK
jgi:hypothetical protein